MNKEVEVMRSVSVSLYGFLIEYKNRVIVPDYTQNISEEKVEQR